MRDELIIEKNPKSSIAEAMRIIRTNIQFSSVDKKVKTLLITSSVSGEGKSFISSNLAVTFAQTGSKVLVVDCDMRKGRLHKIFNMSNEKGLSNLLLGNVEQEYKEYIRKTKINNLSLLSSGITPPNPSELLDSSKNQQLIKILYNNYDYIIFDGTPIGGLTDSIIMTKFVDKVIVVCSVNYTKTEQLANTTKALENIGADIAGVIVNKVPEVHHDYYGNYYIED